jgi:hypothetical protein
MPRESFAPLLQRAQAHALEFLAQLPERHVDARAGRAELLAALQVPLSLGGESAPA